MAEFLFKDRVTSTPNRIKLIKVAEDTYDVEKIPGEIVEEGTPLNAATMNKLAQKSGLIRPNMLINSNFAINTRGKSVYNINGETACDGWEVIKGGGAYYDATTKTLHCVAGGEYAWLRQRMTWIDLTKLIGKTITMSVRCKADRNKYFNIGYYRGTSYISLIQYTDTTVDSDFVTITVSTTIPDTVLATDIFCPRIYCNVPSSDPSGTASLQLEWAKLEIGEYATEYQPPIEGEEFAKVKRYLDKTNISTVMPLSSAAASNDKVLSEKVVYDEFAKTSRTITSVTQLGLTYPCSAIDILNALISQNVWNVEVRICVSSATARVTGLPSNFGLLVIKTPPDLSILRLTVEFTSELGNGTTKRYLGKITRSGDTVIALVFKEFVTVDSPLVYDKIIRTQAEFDALIADPTWLGATSVALVGQFTYSVPNNSGIKIPATVKQIHGYNGAKITITNTTGVGLWYGTRPTTPDYSIRDLEVDCTATVGDGIGFYRCTNLMNCTGIGIGSGEAWGIGFAECMNLTNCIGIGTGIEGTGFGACTNLMNCTGTGTGATAGYGFGHCSNLTNCTGTGTGATAGFGFGHCSNLTNCTGTGTGATVGFGFYSITTASNCRDDGSSTAMWGGYNTNIDIDTCRKTPVEADNTTLNT